ncbi:MAG: response regulator transcription factor [Clostridia bacterium]|nr:response regulator transcription factor [Clostridia bacterium]
MGNTILIADDEKEIVELLSLYLVKDGHRVIEAFDGLEAWDKINSMHIDLAVIDVMMPGIDGYNLVRKIREKHNTPVIILSARSDDSDKILGLGLGADDYMAKPFNPLEVVARVQAQLRRFYTFNSTSKKEHKAETIEIGRLKLDKTSCAVYKDGQEVQLTSIEYKVLALLMEQPGRVYTKSQIFEYIWGEYFDGDDNTVMVHISKIRDKIEDDPKEPKYLKTIRGLGYRFEKKV